MTHRTTPWYTKEILEAGFLRNISTGDTVNQAANQQAQRGIMAGQGNIGAIDARRPARTVRQVVEGKIREAEGAVEHYKALLAKLDKTTANELTMDELHELTNRT